MCVCSWRYRHILFFWKNISIRWRNVCFSDIIPIKSVKKNTSRDRVISVNYFVDLIVAYHEWRARNINRRRERTHKTVSVKCKNFAKIWKSPKVIGKIRRQFAVILTTGLSVLAISDFPSSNYAKFYLTKRKSVKNASDSSLKLISYSSIFASNF